MQTFLTVIAFGVLALVALVALAVCSYMIVQVIWLLCFTHRHREMFYRRWLEEKEKAPTD